MAKIEEKKPIVAEISEFIDGAQSVVAVDYRGLTVAQDTELRKSLREAGVVYKVYKNTFLTRAFEGTDFAQLDQVLEGPTAVAISKDDATAPARVLAKFAKTAPALEIKAGVVEGTFYAPSPISHAASSRLQKKMAKLLPLKHLLKKQHPLRLPLKLNAFGNLYFVNI